MKKLLLIISLIVWAYNIIAQEGIPRSEHPRPQFEREEWINLNGRWSFTFDFSKSGKSRKLYQSKGFDQTILVPFCPESKLSGVEYKDFIPAMWYHRTIQIPESWNGKRILLHFGAIDYFADIYIDGKKAGSHWGGSSSFTLDITSMVTEGKTHDLVVLAEDDVRSGLQTGGKQSGKYGSYECYYTRVTGIWQTVWMEAVDKYGLKQAYIVPELDQQRFVVYPEFYALQNGQKLRINIKDGNKVVSTQTVTAATPTFAVLPVKNMKTWSPESPFLYDIDFEVLDNAGKVIDYVRSYAGMRKIHIESNQFFINNKPYYLRFVLDQGYYPTGLWTAPSDQDLKRDIELGMSAGFNGARLHQKVFEERYHYWADKLGYITWGEAASWGLNVNSSEGARNFLMEWQEIVVRDRNHPSIITWTPFNETYGRENGEALQFNRFMRDVYNLTHSIDYRPVNDASNNYHVMTDIWSVHHYPQTVEALHKRFEIKNGMIPQKDTIREVRYSGQPYYAAEYGGIKWVDGQDFAENTWGYGDGPKTKDEFYQRLEALTDVILSYKYVVGYCYTQLTDVEQEQNGIYNYDRSAKFDMNKIKAIFEKEPVWWNDENK